MSRKPHSVLFLALGLSIGLCLQMLGGSRAGALTAMKNGDIDGDGQVNLSDAINLLNFLFVGGPPPSEIHCDPPVSDPSKLRFLNDLNCNQQNILAQLELCGVSTTKLTNQEVGECQDFEPGPTCAVKVTGDTPCGSIGICGDLNAASGLVYDFVLTFDGQQLLLLLFAQPVLGDGTCPPFPTPGTVPTQVLTGACLGLGAGAAVEAGSWGSARRW